MANDGGTMRQAADGTLWFGTHHDRDSLTRTFYQYSKTGALLSTQGIVGLQGQGLAGGEFEFSRAVPESSAVVSWVLTGLTGLGVLFLVQRRESR